MNKALLDNVCSIITNRFSNLFAVFRGEQVTLVIARLTIIIVIFLSNWRSLKLWIVFLITQDSVRNMVQMAVF